MRRIAIIGIAAVVALAVLLAILVDPKYFRHTVLTPSELALKPISPPSRWAEDCSKIQREVKASRQRIVRSRMLLSEDEVAIYRAVIQRWSGNKRAKLNVENETYPLDVTGPMSSFSDCECLDGIEVPSLVAAAHSFHGLTPDVLSQKNVRLVDASGQYEVIQNNDPGKAIGEGKSVEDAVNEAFASGLFSMSEIAFDAEHHRAIVSYRFHCGFLCGSGGGLLFEKVDGQWKAANRTCGGWISKVASAPEEQISRRAGALLEMTTSP